MPLVSVILPVYNDEKYIRFAIDSVLAQTFTDFEFLIMDDGSTDNTPAIIQSYPDNRIRYIKNEKNLKIVETLNRGIQLSKGKYIARMDSDDICTPERFEKQVAYLEEHPDVTVVDCIMQYIDENGIPLNQYNSTVRNFKEIKRTLPWTNCLGHSSVMYRTQITGQYLYRNIVYEDLDLWYRLINDGHIIERIAIPMLLYRIHTNSITGKAKEENTHFRKLIETKKKYLQLLNSAEKLRLFNVTVWIGMMKDSIILNWKLLKLKFLKK